MAVWISDITITALYGSSSQMTTRFVGPVQTVQMAQLCGAKFRHDGFMLFFSLSYITNANPRNGSAFPYKGWHLSYRFAYHRYLCCGFFHNRPRPGNCCSSVSLTGASSTGIYIAKGITCLRVEETAAIQTIKGKRNALMRAV